MARTQQRKRRRKKRRGTQAGTVDRGGPRGRPRNRAEARARARSRTKRAPQQRQQAAPTWRSAINRGLIAAGIFLLLLIVLFQRPFGEAIALSAFMLLVYIPMGYYLDRFFYNLRQRREAKKREQSKADGDGK